jgi:hypothetical protein
MGGDGKDRAALSEVVRAGKAAAERDGAQAPQLPFGVPPSRKVHLSEAGDDEAKPEKLVVVEGVHSLGIAAFCYGNNGSAPPWDDVDPCLGCNRAGR